jgi:ferrous iron transport protein B
MGMEWQASVALISGIPAKEIVVSTMSVLYSQPGDAAPVDDEELSAAVSDRITRSMSLPTAVAFLIFSLLYLPCIATIMAIASELNWKWALGSALYNTAVAWFIAWIGYYITILLM